MNMQPITLQVSFDIDQESERLTWSFLGVDGKPINKQSKVESGLFVFEAGDTMHLAVKALSYRGKLVSASVLDARLITRPILHSKRVHPKIAGEYPFPSPFFDPLAATPEFCATVGFGEGDASGNAESMMWRSPQTYLIRNQGRWNTSFIMTVAVDGGAGVEYRVFGFDPECQVGTGAEPDPN